MTTPIHLKHEESLLDPSSRERFNSNVPSVLSMKSDKSMAMPIHLKHEDSLPDQSSGKRFNPSVSRDKPVVMPINLKHKESLPDQKNDPPSFDSEIQQRFKSQMKTKHRCVVEGLAKQENPTLLNEIYTELYITESEIHI